MFTSRIRGGTPISDEDAQLLITDPALLADLEEINQHFRTQRALRLQAAVIKANTDYQPPPDIRTPDREDSPSLNGLPTPSSSPPPGHPKLQRTQLQPPATDKPASSQPATCMADLGLLAESEALSELSRRRQAQQIQAAVDTANTECQPSRDIYVPNREDSVPLGGHLPPTISLHFDFHNSLNNQIPRTATSELPSSRPIPSYVESPYQRPKALKSSRARISQRSTIVTRSKASPHTIFVELDNSAGRARNTAFRSIPARKANVSAQVASHSTIRPTPFTASPTSRGVKKRKTKRWGRARKG